MSCFFERDSAHEVVAGEAVVIPTRQRDSVNVVIQVEAHLIVPDRVERFANDAGSGLAADHLPVRVHHRDAQVRIAVAVHVGGDEVACLEDVDEEEMPASLLGGQHLAEGRRPVGLLHIGLEPLVQFLVVVDHLFGFGGSLDRAACGLCLLEGRKVLEHGMKLGELFEGAVDEVDALRGGNFQLVQHGGRRGR